MSTTKEIDWWSFIRMNFTLRLCLVSTIYHVGVVARGWQGGGEGNSGDV